MPSIASLLPKLVADFPTVHFKEGAEFRFSPTEHTVYYLPEGAPLLLHELSHALLGHENYSKDIDLLKMERDAWIKAVELAAAYKIEITDDTVQDHLDSYRDWLHDRSTCPSCNATGRQISSKTYHCDACGQEWRVNEARLCGLKRYRI